MVNSLTKPHVSTSIRAKDHKLTPADSHDAKFSSLWHPQDFIQADIPVANQKPNWERISNYPLDPIPLFRRWSSPTRLIGVSFGNTTRYCLLDIDTGSQYHPQRGLEALRTVLSSLEDIGLVRPLIVRSSASEGLHIYFPLPNPVKTFRLAHLLRQTLEKAGLAIKAGQLEIFPNTKTWKPKGQGFSLYNAHRLPLQQDSYLLDQDLNPQSNKLEQFLIQWEQAAAHQDQETLEQAIAAIKIRNKITLITQDRSRKAEDWYQDEKARIETGWTGPSQTNDLLLAIGRFGRVFNGSLDLEENLAGEALVQYMVERAKNCPGYQEYCRHQHEIEKRCRAWQQSIEDHYSPYRSHPARLRTGLTNEQRSQAAQAKITAAVTELETSNTLPPTTRKRYEAIIPYGISKATLYKYEHLWHPKHYKVSVPSQPEPIPAITDKPPETANPLSSSLVHTPPIRSLGQLQEAPPNQKIASSVDPPPDASQGLTAGTLTGIPEQLLEVPTHPPALNQIPILDTSVSSSLPEVQPSPEELTEFNEWFQLAHRTGIVIDSDVEAGSFWVLTAAGGWEPWTEVSAMFTPRRLRRMLELESRLF